MANTRTIQDYSDWQASRTPVKATRKGQVSPIDSGWWVDFVTQEEANKIAAALKKGNIKFHFVSDPALDIHPDEPKTCPLYTLTTPDGALVELNASDILAVMWKKRIDQPGVLYFNGTSLSFWPDPVAAPAPRPLVETQLPQFVGFDEAMAVKEILENLRKTPGWVRL